MPNQFHDFQQQVEAVKSQHLNGEISEAERDSRIRQMQLTDEVWGDIWMLSPAGQWFRQAKGSDRWVRDYPIALVDPASLPPISRMDLPQIARAVHDCTRCPLHQERTRAVPGEGNPEADIMLIGEGPGFHEDRQARPFVGASGKFLEELLGNIGYKRADVFIANVVKCRPPRNRDPQPEELEACRDYLDRQIELVDPKVIVTLGRFSMYRYFPGASISKIHGQPKRVGDRLIVPMFHPAAALHQPKWRPQIIEDFQKLPHLIAEAAAFRQPEDNQIDPDSTEQLSLF
jgi:uracil-DNA glycosylase family 4